MKKNYYCTVCHSQIRVGDFLVLAAKNTWNDKGLVLLSAEIGDYHSITHPDFEVKKGEEYKFYCPVCHAILNDKDKHSMVKVFMEEDGKHYEVYFSSIAGEQVTYKVKDKEIQRYGLEDDRYEKYFDLEEEYKKFLH